MPRLALLLLAVVTIGGIRALPFYSAAQAARPDLRYTGANGREYPYLISQDSYSWVRKARNYVDSGTPCDEIVGGQCRDNLRHAPLGSEMPYAESLHIPAIAWLHRLLTIFDPQRPIEASAFWLQVIVGMVGAAAAFVIGDALGGPIGGLAAALLSGLNRTVLGRSLGADNDVWNVTLPLCAAAAAIVAQRARLLRQTLAAAAAGGIALGLHACIWSGWSFGLAFVLSGLAAATVWDIVAGDRWRSVLLRQGRLVAGVVGGLLLTIIVFRGGSGFVALLRPPAPTTLAANPAIFPDGLRWVTELQRPSLASLAAGFGGLPRLLAAWFAAVVLLLPPIDSRRRPSPSDLAIAGGGLGVLALWLVGATRLLPDHPTLCVISLLLPVVVLLSGRARMGRPGEPGEAGAVLLLLAWVSAALLVSSQAVRFVLLLSPVVGALTGAALGNVVGRLSAILPRPYVIAGATILLGVVLYKPVDSGYRVAANTLPRASDGWWEPLTQLRDDSPADSILFSWWDYGYWIEYASERPTALDGASLLTRVPHWLARALFSASEREAVGLLRMLSCGSDFAPAPEGKQGAYEQLMATGLDGVRAYNVVVELSGLDRPAAAERLSRLGVPPEAHSDILAATHCDPRPAYLILSSRLLRNIDLLNRGSWDVRRAELVHHLRDRPDAEALGALQQFGFDEVESRKLLGTARSLETSAQIDRFIAPTLPFASTWGACKPTGSGEMSCPIQPRRMPDGSRLVGFRYPPDDPGRGVLQYRRGPSGPISEKSPHTTMILGGPQLQAAKGDPLQPYAVVLDRRRQRIVVGDHTLMGSVFSRLMLLDGQFLEHFEKVTAKQARGERVSLWRVRW